MRNSSGFGMFGTVVPLRNSIESCAIVGKTKTILHRSHPAAEGEYEGAEKGLAGGNGDASPTLAREEDVFTKI